MNDRLAERCEACGEPVLVEWHGWWLRHSHRSDGKRRVHWPRAEDQDAEVGR